VHEARFRSKINLFRTQSIQLRVNPGVKPGDVRSFTVGHAVAGQRQRGALPSAARSGRRVRRSRTLDGPLRGKFAREPPEGQRHD
jgi:hypothetical protein